MPRFNNPSPASKLKRGIILFFLILLIALSAVYCVFAYRLTGTVYPTLELFDGLPTVRFVDVGQGDCTLVTYKGDSVLVDAGSAQNGMTTAEYVSTFAPVIDYFIITHPHEDHMGGAQFIFDEVKVKNLVLSSITVESEFYSQAIFEAHKQGTNIIYLSGPCEFVIGDISITVLDTFGVEYSDLNDASMITRIDVCETSILITGDAESVAEKYALSHNSADLLDCDILKLGHHGSSTSTTKDFLLTVSPEICVASAGRNNSYGHPSNEVVDRILEYGAILHRTDTDGNVVLRGEK